MTSKITEPREFLPLFADSQDQEETFHQNDLIQLFPFGIGMGTEGTRPLLLLKDVTHELTLPVSVSPIEAGVSLTQSNLTNTSGVHHFAELLLQTLNMTARQCVFVQIKGPHQYVRIYLTGHANASSIRLRADEAMSLCQELKIPIFATRSFIQRSRTLMSETEGLAKNVQAIPQINHRPHPYVM